MRAGASKTAPEPYHVTARWNRSRLGCETPTISAGAAALVRVTRGDYFGSENGAAIERELTALSFLQQHFGKSGSWYYRISRGIDERPVQPNRERKSIGAEDTFAVDIFDFEAARAELIPLVGKVWRHCEAKQLFGRTVTLKVKYVDFQQIARSRTVGTSLHGITEVESVARGLLQSVFPTEKGIRLIGVTVSSFSDDKQIGQNQLSLMI